MSIELVMPSSHLILCRPVLLLPQSLPASESFPMSQLFTWGGQRTGVSALASVLPKNTQGWSPLEWTTWISLQSKGLSRVFFNTTVLRVTKQRGETHTELGGLAELRRLRYVTFRWQHSGEEDARTRGEPRTSAFNCLFGSCTEFSPVHE